MVLRNQPLKRISFCIKSKYRRKFSSMFFEEEICIYEASLNVFVSLLVNWAVSKANDLHDSCINTGWRRF